MTKTTLQELLHGRLNALSNAGFSQRAIAEMLGVSQSTISRWQAGTQSPTACHVGRLARFLSMRAEDILGLMAEEVASG